MAVKLQRDTILRELRRLRKHITDQPHSVEYGDQRERFARLNQLAIVEQAIRRMKGPRERLSVGKGGGQGSQDPSEPGAKP